MNRIRELRQQRKWRQSDLAELLNTNQQTIGRYEQETRGLAVDVIYKLCDVFGCTADYLLGRSDLPSNDLSQEEQEMILAFRKADWNYQEAVRQILAPFTGEATTAESAK